ncbi:uncharacterized protein LOC142767169 [Rhipicephalus microplus]|uniref:uncharacterized protein LOC142767169 n=1 Tax=Rhipicephalus microplus TaxID=6941 RepID=UPI003F6BD497
MSLTRSARHPVLRTPYVGTLAGAMTEHSLPAATFLLSWLAAVSARRNDLPPYPADVVHKPDPTYCLTPVNLPFYKSLRMYEFETSEDKSEPRVMSLIYGYSRFVASIFVPARIPRVLLSEKFIENPKPYLVENVLSLFVDFPALTLLVVACVVLAVVVPVRGFWTVCCRHPDVAQCEGHDEEWERVACTAGLVCCCILMLIFASFTIVALVHVPMGVNNIVPQSHRIIRDIMLFFDKTKHEIDALLVRDYDTFEADFDRRIDSCVVKIGEDFKGIVGESPIEEVQKSVRHVALIDECLKNATALGVELDALVEQLKQQRVGIHARIAAAVAECASKAPAAARCMELNKTFDLVPSQAASPHQLHLGDLNRFVAKLDGLRPSDLEKQVDLVAQLPLTTEGVQHTFSTDAKDIKLEVEYFGSDLEDLVDQFTASWVRHPDRLNSMVRESYGRYVSILQPLVRVNSLIVAPLGAVLFLIVTFYSTGVALFHWSSDPGNVHRRSRWCLFLGVFVFLLLFGVAMLATAAGLTVGFTLQRSVCDVAADPTTPAFADMLRFGMKVARDWEIVNGSREALSHVSVDVVQDIFKRFVKCHDHPLSLYKLLGDQLMRNITSAGGTDWAFSWLWSGVDDPLLSEKLAHFIDPKVPLIPKHINMLTDIETKMNDVRAVKFGDLNMLAYLRDVSSLDFSTDAFVPLSTKLSDIQETVPDYVTYVSSLGNGTVLLCCACFEIVTTLVNRSVHTHVKDTLKQKVSDILEQVKVTVDAYAKGEPLKNDIMKILEEVLTLQVVDGKSIDDFNRDIGTDLASRTTGLKPVLIRVLGGSGRYKQQIIQVVGTYVTHISKAIVEEVGRCGPAYAIFESAFKTACLDVVAPYNSVWASLLTYLLVGVVAAALAIGLTTLYMRTSPEPAATDRHSTSKHAVTKPAADDAIQAEGDAPPDRERTSSLGPLSVENNEEVEEDDVLVRPFTCSIEKTRPPPSTGTV